jgi:hypothetical protein
MRGDRGKGIPNEEAETQQSRLMQMFANAFFERDNTHAILSLEDPQLMPRLRTARQEGRLNNAIFQAWTDHPLLAKALDAQLLANPSARYSSTYFPREEVYARVIELMPQYGADASGFPRDNRIIRIDPYTRVKFLNFLINQEYCSPREAAEALYDEVAFDRLEDRFRFDLPGHIF